MSSFELYLSSPYSTQTQLQVGKYSPSDLLDIVAMRVEGVMRSWINVMLQDLSVGHRAAFLYGMPSNKQWFTGLS